MSGALTLSGDPTSTNQAANRHYVDLQNSGVNGAVSQTLSAKAIRRSRWRVFAMHRSFRLSKRR
jgi:hypothetical protein